MDFTGKVALVTGAGNGIGRATVEGFARLGAHVVIVDLDAGAGEQSAELVRRAGGEAVSIVADVTRSEDVRRYVDTALSAYGRIDCFFNNAGVGGPVAPITEYDEEAFNTVMRVNVNGVFLGLKHVLPHMTAQGSGAVVNTASVAGLLPSLGMAAYVASKHAVIGLTKTAAAEVARSGVRVNAVCPGPVETRAMRWLEEQQEGDVDEVGRRSRASQPTGRYSTAEEIANVALFLCSDLASNTTGAQYVVDGGRSATGGAVPSR